METSHFVLVYIDTQRREREEEEVGKKKKAKEAAVGGWRMVCEVRWDDVETYGR